MKFSIARELLLKPLQLVAGVVEKRQTIAILANVLLDVTKKSISITGSDSEIELKSSVELHEAPEEVGAITVPGRKLMDICRTLPEGSILDFELNGNHLKVTSDNSSFNLTTLPANGFPLTQLNNSESVITLKPHTLLSLLKHTSFAIAEQSAHYYLQGMCLEIKGGVVAAVASDAHRLAMYEVEDAAQKKVNAQIIVPRKTVLELVRLLGISGSDVKLEMTENYLRVLNEDFVLTSKLIDSKYPNPAKLLPRGGNKKVVVDRATLKSSLTRVAILSNEVLRNAHVKLRENRLQLITTNPEYEKAEEELPVKYKGADLDIGFNIAYLLDIVNAAQTNELLIIFKDSESGVIFEEVDGDDNCLYVVMPLEI